MANSSTEDKRMQQRFQRHSRPQIPIIQATGSANGKRVSRVLNVQSSPSWQSSLSIRSTARGEERSRARQRGWEWIDFIQLGTLCQGEVEMIVCSRRDDRGDLFMFIRLQTQDASFTQRIINLQHPNLIQARCMIDNAAGQHIGFNYVKFTLEEILNVHMTMEELHLRAIAQSVFPAIKYLNDNGLHHGHITTNSIRVCGRTGKVFLGEHERCTRFEGEPTNTDLESLGLILLDCMEKGHRRSRSAEQIRQARATNRVFGLADAEKWSGCKQLMDFLDDTFCYQRKVSVKFQRPHDFTIANQQSANLFQPFVEVASLECFTMWRAAQRGPQPQKLEPGSV